MHIGYCIIINSRYCTVCVLYLRAHTSHATIPMCRACAMRMTSLSVFESIHGHGRLQLGAPHAQPPGSPHPDLLHVRRPPIRSPMAVHTLSESLSESRRSKFCGADPPPDSATRYLCCCDTVRCALPAPLLSPRGCPAMYAVCPAVCLVGRAGSDDDPTSSGSRFANEPP